MYISLSEASGLNRFLGSPVAPVGDGARFEKPVIVQGHQFQNLDPALSVSLGQQAVEIEVENLKHWAEAPCVVGGLIRSST